MRILRHCGGHRKSVDPATTHKLQQPNPMTHRKNPRFVPATLASILFGLLLGIPTTLAVTATDPHLQQIIVTQDLAQCGHAEHILFTILWQARIGIASEPAILGWEKPRAGDRLSGEFMEEGLIEATYLNRTGTTWLSVTRTGEALDRQAPLMRQYCKE